MLIPVALGLGYLALLSVFWNLGHGAPPSLAPASLRAHPETTMNMAVSMAMQGGQTERARGRELASSSLAIAPLEEEAFVLAANGATANRDLAKADRLLRLAVRRNPRSRLARAYLMQTSIRLNDVGEAVRQVEALDRLQATQTDRLRSMLAMLASFDQSRRPILDAITRESLKRGILRDMARLGVSAEVLEESLNLLEPLEWQADESDFGRALAVPLLRNGDWQGARRIWARFQAGPPTDSAIVDPDLTGAFAPPFGWEVETGREGYARLGTDGLTGEFYGKGSPVLARQVTPLEPGTYQLSVSNTEGSSVLELAVSCQRSEPLAEIPLRDAVETIRFETDEQCPVVEIIFSGKPSDPPKVEAFVVRHVELERIGS